MSKNKIWLICSIIIFLAGAIFIFTPNFVPNLTSTTVNPINLYQHPLIPRVINSLTPQIVAPNYILVDVDTNSVLLSQNKDSRIYPASTTKLATALTALNIYPLDEVVKIGSTYSDGKIMQLLPDEEIDIKSLVTALLVYSANDAAYNLASHHRDGVSGFVKEMNLIAAKYNLKNTHFTNFDGIHSDNHYSTVFDLSQLGRLAIKNKIIRDTVKSEKITVTDISGKIVHELTTTNELLGKVSEIEGLKTGWTPEAKGSFIGLINLHGHYLISVVASSDDRFADTKELINWAKQSIVWQPYNSN